MPDKVEPKVGLIGNDYKLAQRLAEAVVDNVYVHDVKGKQAAQFAVEKVMLDFLQKHAVVATYCPNCGRSFAGTHSLPCYCSHLHCIGPKL